MTRKTNKATKATKAANNNTETGPLFKRYGLELSAGIASGKIPFSAYSEVETRFPHFAAELINSGKIDIGRLQSESSAHQRAILALVSADLQSDETKRALLPVVEFIPKGSREYRGHTATNPRVNNTDQIGITPVGADGKLGKQFCKSLPNWRAIVTAIPQIESILKEHGA